MQSPGSPKAHATRRRDPGRAQRIARAAVDIVSENGVAGLTHRAVADAAGVPLGSTTYYFATLDDIFEAAVTEAMRMGLRRLDAWRSRIASHGDVAAGLADLIEEATGPERASLRVEWELYLAAVRNPHLRPLSAEWGNMLPEVLRSYTDPLTAEALTKTAFGVQLDALISGNHVRAADTLPIFRRVMAGNSSEPRSPRTGVP